MLTASQCRTVAYTTANDSIVCPNCALPRDTNDGITEEMIEYTAEEYANGDGLYCEDCGGTIVEPTPQEVTLTVKLEMTRGELETFTKEVDSWLDSLDYVTRVRSIAVDED